MTGGNNTMSLILQVADDCIKCYKYFSEAAHMPETHRGLQTRFHMEQRRFLIFAEQAGLLSTQTEIFESVVMNTALLKSILLEIKILFESFQQANGQYVDLVRFDEFPDLSDAQPSILELICTTEAAVAQVDTSAASTVSGSSKRDSFMDKVKKKAKDLRTIIVEPKRLVWVSLDQKDFKDFIAKLGELNTFLISLLDRSSIQSIDRMIQESYLAMLEVKTDIKSLGATVKTLTQEVRQQDGVYSFPTPFGDFFPPQVAEQETQSNERRISYMKQLAEVKIRRLDTGDDTLDPAATIGGEEKATELDITDSLVSLGVPGNRQIVSLDDEYVWIEPIDYSSDGLNRSIHVWGGSIDGMSCINHRVNLLTKLLSIALPKDFRTPPCHGYINIRHEGDEKPTFSLVLKLPKDIAKQETKIFSLRELLISKPMPSLSIRISLCCELTECLANFHAVDWLHKGFRSQNVLFFGPDAMNVNLSQPYLTGLELSRPREQPELTDQAKPNPEADMYLDPLVQGGENAGAYRKSYDLYGLGMILIEIAFWLPIEKVLGFEILSDVTPDTLRSIKSLILGGENQPPRIGQETRGSDCLQQVAVLCGDSFRDIVRILLSASELESPEYRGEKALSRSRRLRDTFVERVLGRLQMMRDLM